MQIDDVCRQCLAHACYAMLCKYFTARFVDSNHFLPQMEDSEFPLTFRQPANCDRQSCDVYAAMGPNAANDDFLDIYLEGTADGWVAVGFSKDTSMVCSERCSNEDWPFLCPLIVFLSCPYILNGSGFLRKYSV